MGGEIRKHGMVKIYDLFASCEASPSPGCRLWSTTSLWKRLSAKPSGLLTSHTRTQFSTMVLESTSMNPPRLERPGTRTTPGSRPFSSRSTIPPAAGGPHRRRLPPITRCIQLTTAAQRPTRGTGTTPVRRDNPADKTPPPQRARPNTPTSPHTSIPPAHETERLAPVVMVLLSI
jgi:hypothetical protein